jgi:glyoxylase-like metal-dependent hydrolase (beta-lactamase superfamily II)
MNTVTTTHRLTPDVTVLAQAAPVPGRGFLPVLSYVLTGRQPVLVDTGAVRGREGFLSALESVVDPADLAWIVLTHPDDDHAGALEALLARAPKARLVTNWIASGKLSASFDPPMNRVTWVNPGDALTAGDRVLHALRAPMYDCPSTTLFFDSKSRALLTSDAFGAFVPRMAETIGELDERDALEGMSVFCRANSPWLADVRPDRYEASLKEIAGLEASWLLSGHLPAVPEPSVARVIARAASFPLEGRVTAPGQQALAAALAHAAAA